MSKRRRSPSSSPSSPVWSAKASRILSASSSSLVRMIWFVTAARLPARPTIHRMADLWVTNLGVVEYREAYALHERLRAARRGRVRAARQEEGSQATLLLLEHFPVYTRGRRTGPGELPMGEDSYRTQGIDVVDVDRGGRVTYHGPGQLVGYPIMRTDEVIAFVRTMERAIVTALAD